ncbi:low molecular weight protein-tyrosine-phosphatase [Phytoactinopolyspora halotolerans]
MTPSEHTPPRSKGSPFKVCVVCAGNICRSPMAEAVLRVRLANAGLSAHVEVSSAGTGSWHIGEQADPRARRTLQAHGYDAAAHRARQFTDSWFADFDLVLALDSANFADLQRIAPDDQARAKIRMLRSYASHDNGRHAADLDVPDPYYGGEDGFDHVLRLVEQAADGLVEAIAAHRAVGDADHPSRS